MEITLTESEVALLRQALNKAPWVGGDTMIRVLSLLAKLTPQRGAKESRPVDKKEDGDGNR